MGRKQAFVTIDEEGRDLGKMFKITEASAVKADKWGIRAMLALNRTGANIPDEIMKLGLAGIMTFGIHKLKGVAWSDLEPLIDELMDCVQIVPTPGERNVVRDLWILPDDIEEISTLAFLRVQVWKLHVGFSKPADQSKSQDGQAGVAA